MEGEDGEKGEGKESARENEEKGRGESGRDKGQEKGKERVEGKEEFCAVVIFR